MFLYKLKFRLEITKDSNKYDNAFFLRVLLCFISIVINDIIICLFHGTALHFIACDYEFVESCFSYHHQAIDRISAIVKCMMVCILSQYHSLSALIRTLLSPHTESFVLHITHIASE